MSRILLEVCTATLDDALAAAQGGADRLELNSALELGGLTPSPGVFLRIREVVSLPLCVMIRPRPGGFHYSANEFQMMIEEAKWFLNHGADAIVFGILTEDGLVDMNRCREIVELAGTGRAIFHRAFDLTPEPKAALEQLIHLGFARVMTSGQQPVTLAGCSLINELISQAAGRIEILPAGGIKTQNMREVIAHTGCDQIHASLRSDREDRSARHRPAIQFGSASGDGECFYRSTDVSLVKKMRDLLDGLHNHTG
ncbi:copper homeostasis protein CutC [Zavarzinella formosa]|uniref:copper homeostasis protein CutC n=1 Tax=Zavarzinella formosa TaxID=360055 RepID=UPI00030E6AFD|nr:copper homeostasis protein CutC [Zavarzinella formosa]